MAVTWPTSNPGPAGRVVVVVVVVGGAADVVVAVGRVVAEGGCVEVDVAEVSSTTKIVAAATTATTMTATAVTFPDGRLRLGLVAWRAMLHSFAASGGDLKSDPVYRGSTASSGHRRTPIDWLAVARRSPSSDHK